MPPDEPSTQDRVRAAATPAAFSRLHFGWSPYPYQEEVMDAVLRRGITRVAWVAGRRVGKTDTTANIALQLAVKKPGTQVAIFAPTVKQASILSKRIKYLLHGSSFKKNVVVDNVAEMRLRFGTDAKGKPRESVIFANSMTGKVRGEGADVLIVDESAFCNGEDYRSKALPFIADRPNAIVIHISTVWSEDDHFMDALRLYPTLAHGAVFRTPTKLKPGVTEELLAELRATMLESEYRREYECELVPEGGVFDRRALAACQRDYELAGIAGLAQLESKGHHAYYVGVDWGKKQDRAVIAVVEQGRQDRVNPARLVFLQVYEPDPRNPHHYTRILEDVQRVAKQVEARRVVADEGEGGHQAEVLRRALGGRFRPFRFTGRSRNWLVENARFLVEKRGVELPLEPDEVRRAFANVQRTEDGYEHASRRTKDVFDAIGMALLEASAAGVRERGVPMKLLPLSQAAGTQGPRSRQARTHPPPDPRRAWIPREAWRYLR